MANKLKRHFLALGLAASFATNSFAQATIPPSREALAGQPVEITVDLHKPLGPYKPIYSWFGYDEINYTTMRNGKQLLGELHDLSPVPVYIRAHHLLTSGDGKPELKWSSTNVYSEDASGRPIYDFKILDAIFDEYKAAGVRPMVEFGFMPEALAADLPDRHEPYQVHFPASVVSGKSNNPPKDYAKWGELVRVVTQHFVERYGRDAVTQWYFEVWNEPDIDYWHATPEDYWKLYDYAVAGVRAALPEAKVGGPATTSPSGPKAYAFLRGFLDHANSGTSAVDGKRVPLDFISFHAKGKPSFNEGQVTMGISNELADVDRGFDLVSRYPNFRSLPIILSEADPEGCAACSSKTNPANNYRNGALYPAYTAAVYKRLFSLQDKYNVTLISMLSWSFEFEDHDYFEGFRSLATNGVDKPVLNFFRMAARMSGTRITTTSSGEVALDEIVKSGVRNDADVDAIATRAGNNVAVMLWNYHDVDGRGPAAPTTLTVDGLPATAKQVLVSHFRIDESHSNAYTVWKAMGSPQRPTADQYAELQSKANLELLSPPEWKAVANGKLTLQVAMPRQSVSLIQFSW
jgi:xylan 1,4-beta-xylosidase